MTSRQTSIAVASGGRLRRSILPFLCLLAGLSLPGCGDPNQAMNVGGALSQARRTNQIVLVEFWGFEEACSQMDNKVYTNPLVTRDLEDFVRVRMNYAMNRDTARNWGITAAPGFAALRPDGSLIAARTGYMDSDDFRQFLVRAKIFLR